MESVHPQRASHVPTAHDTSIPTWSPTRPMTNLRLQALVWRRVPDSDARSVDKPVLNSLYCFGQVNWMALLGANGGWSHVKTGTCPQRGCRAALCRIPGERGWFRGRATDSWSKSLGFESRQERRKNFLLQGQLSVPESASVPRGTSRVTTKQRCNHFVDIQKRAV